MNVGPVQNRLLRRARQSPARMVKPAGYLERRACRRLEARGFLVPTLGFPDCWRWPH